MSLLSACRAPAAILVAFVAPLAFAENWPEFRGPTGQGISTEKGIPVEWGPEKNVAWKAEIPGGGWSSPVYWNGRVYLTTAVPVEGGKPNDRHLNAMCLDAATGETVWDKTVVEQKHAAAGGLHGKNSYASPTPVTDGRHLFVHFGAQGTACLTLDGDIVWSKSDLRYDPVHGGGSSPVLVDDLLFVNCDGRETQFVVARDAATGETRWRKDRPPLVGGKGFAFCTPLVIEANGQKQIVSPAADHVVAYRPEDGKELWRFEYEGYSIVPRPVFGHGLVFVSTSFDDAVLYALKLQPGRDPEVAWSTRKGAPSTPSPLLVGDEVYFVSDRGVGTCADARTGTVHWTERLGGNYSASPVFAGGNIYFQNEDGGTVVVRPGTEFREVARNSLPGRTLASYAVADSSIFLRTDTHLYRIKEAR
jgi:outer membrane protein assembly factor BamB